MTMKLSRAAPGLPVRARNIDPGEGMAPHARDLKMT